MTRHHRSLTRTPRQQAVRTRSSLYHTPPQRSPLANSVAPSNSDDNETTAATEERRPQIRRNQGLKEHLQKQLLKDIEDNGGLRVFSLARLVNEKSDTYGGVDSTLRRQVQNCVDRWKRQTDSEYLLLLNYFGVRAASLQSSFYPSHSESSIVAVIPETDTRIEASSSLSFQSSSRERNRSTSSQVPRSQQINEPQSSFPTQTFISPSRYSRHSNMNTNALALRPMAGINDGFEDLIMVNLTYPERNREVQVFCFTNHRNAATGDIVSGFQIMMPVDYRDIAKDLYKLEIVQDNELLLHMPSLPFSIQFDSVARHAELNRLDVMCDRCQEAQEICITDIDAAPARRHKTLRLRFPEHIILGNMASSIDSELPMEIQPYKFPYAAAGTAGAAPLLVVSCNVSWRVASIDTHRKAQGSAKKTNETLLSELFGHMLRKQPQRSDTNDQKNLAQQRTIDIPSPHQNLFETPKFQQHQFSLSDATSNRKPLHQDQLLSTYSWSQVKASGKSDAKVLKESKIALTSKSAVKATMKVKHQMSSKHSKMESKTSNIDTIDCMDCGIACTTPENQTKGLLLSSPTALNSSLQKAAQVEQLQLTHTVPCTTGPVLTSPMMTNSIVQTAAQFQEIPKACPPQVAHPVYMYSRQGKRRPESQVCGGDEEDPVMAQLQKWQALDNIDEDDVDV